MALKQKVKTSEIILCVVLSLVIVAAGLVGYAQKQKLWMFAEVKEPLTLQVSGALLGGMVQTQPGWHYAVAPAAVRVKADYTPEAVEWTAGYYYHWNRAHDMSIAADVTEGEFPVLVQWDKRWGYEIYGTNYMANNGCGPTALCIVYAGLTGKTDWNPYSLAMYSIENDLYMANVGTKWIFMKDVGRYLGLTVQEFNEYQLDQALPELQAGKVLICKVGPGDFTTGGHFIAVTRLYEDGTVEVRDPNSREKSAVLWDYEQIIAQTQYVWSYTYDQNAL